jgi:hypothetical protein
MFIIKFCIQNGVINTLAVGLSVGNLIAQPRVFKCHGTVTDLINALPGKSSINTVEHAAIEEAVFSVDPTDAPIDWLDSDHVIYVYCRSMSLPRLYK